MKSWLVARPGDELSVLFLGAHSDDIEIGAGATILGWISSGVRLNACWCIASATGDRAEEARKSAAAFLEGALSASIIIGDFQDSFFPYHGERLKKWVETVRSSFRPDIIFTHRRDDGHQDHREICQLTWNAFRNHTIFEYEIPKWDGDLCQLNTYMPVHAKLLEKKIKLLMEHFGTQRSKDWFDPETFRGLARLRGVECRAPEGYAEAFNARKIVLE